MAAKTGRQKQKKETLSGNKLSITRGSALMERAQRSSYKKNKKKPSSQSLFRFK